MEWKMKKYKDLTIEELYKILKVRNEVFVVEQQCPYQDCDGKDQFSYHLFLEDNKEIIAYCRIVEKGVSYDNMSIGRVLVIEKYRRKGVARKMLINAIRFIEENLNETTIRISGQLYLKDFYKNLDFKEVTDVYLEDNIPHIEMLYQKANNKI